MTRNRSDLERSHRDQHDRHRLVTLDSSSGTYDRLPGTNTTKHRTDDARLERKESQHVESGGSDRCAGRASPGPDSRERALSEVEGRLSPHKKAYAVFAALPSNPSLSAIPCSASMQKAMCSSKSTPRAAAPLTISSRFTLRAKALSFIRFRTDFASTSANDFPGLIRATAVMDPGSSSQAKRAFSMGGSRVTPVYSACDMIARVIT